MTVQVAYTSQLKAALGVDREQIEIDTPCSVDDLLARLLDKHGDPLRRLVCDAAGKPQRTVLVCVRDEHVPWGDPTPVQAGDLVTLLAPISGG